MRKLLLTICLLAAFTLTASAQRFTDKLDRGLVAVPTGSSGNSNSNFVSWRRLADEYYGVKYNVYKDGALVASNLETTNYSGNGSSTSYYQVAAVVNGPGIIIGSFGYYREIAKALENKGLVENEDFSIPKSLPMD